MALPELAVGPQDPDATAALTAKVGVKNKAKQVIAAAQRNMPSELRQQLIKPVQDTRTEALDLEEVRDACLSLKGRRAFLDEDDELLEAKVLGPPGPGPPDPLTGRHAPSQKDEDCVVGILFRTAKSGRSMRAVISYEPLTGSRRAAAELLARQEAGEDAAPAVLTDEDAAHAVQSAEEARTAAEAEAEELRERLEALENPEPWDGYDEENADDVKKRIADGGVREFGLNGLDAIVEYESAHKDRKSVLEAADAAKTESG